MHTVLYGTAFFGTHIDLFEEESAQIGQYGYQITKIFMLIPNPKTKLKLSEKIKSYYKKQRFARFITNNFLLVPFF